MTPEQILSIPPRVLTQQQRERYFEDGFIVLERFLPDQWVERLRTVTEQMVEESRSITRSDAKWDLEPTHTAAAPQFDPFELWPSFTRLMLACTARVIDDRAGRNGKIPTEDRFTPCRLIA